LLLAIVANNKYNPFLSTKQIIKAKLEQKLLFTILKLMNQNKPYGSSPRREKLYLTIFHSDTRAGRAFNLVLVFLILLSVFTVMLESIYSIRIKYGDGLITIEWVFTLLFTIEYILRLLSIARPLKYAFSFFGLIDFLAIAPTYLTLFFSGDSFLIIRVLRLLRIFRVFKLPEYLYEASLINEALKASVRKISVFIFSILVLVVIIGSMIYVIEGPKNGFTDIPTSMYWVIVTLTTVGYGDIAPLSAPGKLLASLVMLLGYGIIAVPTGIVSVEISRASGRNYSSRSCPSCGESGHSSDSVFCKYCGNKL